MENKKITNHQLFAFTALSTLGGSFLVVASTITVAAGRDAWMSSIVTFFSGMVMMWLYCYLGTRFDGQTLVGILKKIFGKWIGTIISVLYLFYFFITAYGVPWYIGGFGSSFMPETPVPIQNMLFIVAIIVGLLYGIESVARASEVFVKVFTVSFLASIILVLPNVNFDYIRPVLEKGVTPVFNGSVFLSVYIAFQNISVLMIYPIAIKDKLAGRKAFMKGFIWANAIVALNLIVALLVLGEAVVTHSAFATIMLAREINVVPILTRFEYVISIIWIASEFVIAFLYYYATALAGSELLRLRDHRKIVLPIGLIMLVLSFSDMPGAVEHTGYMLTGYVPMTIMFGVIIPIIMLAVYGLRKLFSRGFGAQAG